MSAVHYGGGLTYPKARGTVTCEFGFPVCCSGARAMKVRDAGTQRFDRSSGEITCRRCLALLAQAHP
jgi:hypothetical protein